LGDFDGFLDSLRVRRRPKTVEVYELGLRTFREMLVAAGRDLDTIDPGDLDRFVLHLRGRDASPSTTHTYCSAVLKFADHLRREGRTLDLRRPDLPRVRQQVTPHLDDAALGRYVVAVRKAEEPFRTCLLLLPLTGLRVQEVCHLHASDVSFEQAPWIVLRVRDSKGDDRLVPLLRAGNAVLENYMERAWPRLPTEPPADPFLFPHPKLKGSVQPLHLRKRLGRLVPGVAPHALRHTYATNLERAGITGLALSFILGHKNPRTTQRYVHHRIDEIAQRLDAVPTPWLGGSP